MSNNVDAEILVHCLQQNWKICTKLKRNKNKSLEYLSEAKKCENVQAVGFTFKLAAHTHTHTCTMCMHLQLGNATLPNEHAICDHSFISSLFRLFQSKEDRRQQADCKLAGSRADRAFT